MKCTLAIAVLACVFFISFVYADDDCSWVMKSYMKKKLEIAESGEVACATRLELAQYICGGDPERAKVVLPKYVAFMKSLSAPEKMEAMKCFGQLSAKAIPAINIPGNCKEAFDKQLAEMHKKFQSDS